MKKMLILVVALVGILALVGCGGSKTGTRPAAAYVMDEPVPAGAENARKTELLFTADDIQPDKITMKAGEKLLFVIKNTDKEEDHNFLSPEAELPEILVHPGQTARRLYTAPAKAGTYTPSCAIHPWIRMTFVVQ